MSVETEEGSLYIDDRGYDLYEDIHCDIILSPDISDGAFRTYLAINHFCFDGIHSGARETGTFKVEHAVIARARHQTVETIGQHITELAKTRMILNRALEGGVTSLISLRGTGGGPFTREEAEHFETLQFTQKGDIL